MLDIDKMRILIDEIVLEFNQRHGFVFDVEPFSAERYITADNVAAWLARRIIESRAASGRFADLDELRRVRGIGPKTLQEMKPYLRPLPGAASTVGP